MTNFPIEMIVDRPTSQLHKMLKKTIQRVVNNDNVSENQVYERVYMVLHSTYVLRKNQITFHLMKKINLK